MFFNFFFFFFNDTATTEIYTLSLHDALPICRLPGKPLADIAGEPMIVHVMRQALAAGIGPVAVATDSRAIAACVEKAGGQAVMTRADHGSGSDRIFEALQGVDPTCRAEVVVNLQGDLPTLAPADIAAALLP